MWTVVPGRNPCSTRVFGALKPFPEKPPEPQLSVLADAAAILQLKPGSRVVAYQFNGMGDWKPKMVVQKHLHPVYLWVVPKRERTRNGNL